MRRLLTLVLGAAFALPLAACPGVFITPTTSPDADCQEVRLDSLGNPILPPGTDTATVSVADHGPLQPRHPGFDTSTDEWYGPWQAQECPTLGGIEPPSDVAGDPTAALDSAAAAGVDSLSAALSSLQPPPPLALPHLNPIKPDTTCGPAPCKLPAGSPFNGADIIYVHGLMTQPMLDVVNGAQKPAWPADPADFLSPGGYWRQEAKTYWGLHVQELLDSRGAKNRVLFVGWSSLQRLEYAAHTTLFQIAGAMQSGTGVVLRDPFDPRGTKGFCQPSCVVISHSTGALVTDVAMALAANPALAPPPHAVAFQGVGWIPAHMRVHVSLGGAFSGSQYASASMAVASGLSPGPSICRAAMATLNVQTSACLNLAPLLNSVLFDLMPVVTQAKWGPLIALTPVNVLTIAGGNHRELWPMKRFFAAGFDDGVVNMDSGCGRATPRQSWPAGYIPQSWLRVYDMGQPSGRAVRFFSEQKFEPWWYGMPSNRASAACSPWKSTTGMVQPVAVYLPGPPLNPYLYYPRHHPFVQTSETHVNGLLDCKEKPAEDQLALATHQPYWLGLVGTGFAGLQEEDVVGRRLFKSKKWLWKRTYHRLHDWQVRCAADYAYEWVI